MFEPDIKTAGRNSARVLAASLLSSAVSRRVRACLKIHSRHLPAPLRGIFGPNSVNVARYASLIGIKSPTKWDAQLTESNFQTRSRAAKPKAVSGFPIPIPLTDGCTPPFAPLKSPPPHKAIHAASPPCPAPAVQRILAPVPVPPGRRRGCQ